MIATVRNSLAAIDSPRLFQTERGFQGELLVQLSERLALPDQAILEQEYQKRMHHHGLTIRPDIIVHDPFDPARHAVRTEGNIAVMELKLSATEREALEDFASLAQMILVLNYPIGFFVNIASILTYDELIPDGLRDRIISFAVSLQDGETRVLGQHA